MADVCCNEFSEGEITWKIYFVDDWNDLKVVLQSNIYICKRLSLYTLHDNTKMSRLHMIMSRTSSSAVCLLKACMA